jgi:hypothetical protein
LSGRHVESGTLLSAFDSITLIKSGKDIAAVAVGDPDKLQGAYKAQRGTIADFVRWLKGERSKRWQGFKSRWAGVKKKQEKRRAELRKIAQAKPKKPRKVAKGKRRVSEVKVTARERRVFASEFVAAIRKAREFHRFHPGQFTFKQGRLSIIRKTWRSMVPQISKRERTQIFHRVKTFFRRYGKS